MTDVLRVGSRGSPLALAQTEEVLLRLRRAHPDVKFETVVIRTHGDEGYREDLGTPLDGKRAFTKRIEDALIAGRIDAAVHSLKDLPKDVAEGLTIAAIPPRGDPRDVFVADGGFSLEKAPGRARVGTSSLRRRAQLLAHWPHFDVRELHGNLGTRLRRLDAKEFDAIVVAAAGLDRLHLSDRVFQPLPPEIMTPAPGQGALAIEARSSDTAILNLLQAIDDSAARRTTDAERELSARIGGGCNVPFGAVATLEAGAIDLRSVIASPDGQRIIRARARDDASRWRDVVDLAWQALVDGGGKAILAEVT